MKRMDRGAAAPGARFPLVVALGLFAACGDATGEGGSPSASVALQPVLPAGFVPGLFDLAVDRVVIRFFRPPGDLVLDTLVFFPVDESELAVRVRVPLAARRETFNVALELRAGETLLFHGTRSLEVTEGTSTAPSVALQYVGPGAALTALRIAPRDTSLRLRDRYTFLVAAAAGEDPVEQFYVSWSSSAPSVAPIDPGGTVTAPQGRASILVRVVSPNGVRDSTLISFSPPAQTLLAISGGGQNGLAGQALADPLVVRAIAADQLGVHGVRVRFQSLSNGTPADTVVVTDLEGYASSPVALGPGAGPQSFQVTAAGVNPLSFAATAGIGPPARLEILAGNQQTDTVGHTLQTPLIARVTDAVGNAVNGVEVNWQVVAGGGSLNRTSTTTGLSGLASVDLTLGSFPGTHVVRASITTPPDAVDFTATAVAGAPSTLIAFAGNNQGDTAAATLAPFVVLLRDQLGNALAGKDIRWLELEGGGLLSSAVSRTGSDGLANATYQLPTVAGTVHVVAEVLGFPISTVLEATVRPAAPFDVAIASGDGQSGPAATVLAPFQVTVTDRFGNPVPGTTVGWSVTEGDATLSAPTSTADGTGRAEITLTLGVAPGPITVRASIAGGGSIDFSAILTP